jgi:hypothetical protein
MQLSVPAPMVGHDWATELVIAAQVIPGGT